MNKLGTRQLKAMFFVTQDSRDPHVDDAVICEVECPAYVDNQNDPDRVTLHLTPDVIIDGKPEKLNVSIQLSLADLVSIALVGRKP